MTPYEARKELSAAAADWCWLGMVVLLVVSAIVSVLLSITQGMQ